MFTDLKLESAPDLWRAVVAGDAARIDDFLGTLNVPGVPRSVDFGKFRGNYEERIFRDGVLPMRTGSLHDFYNLLAWARFPLSKRTINRIHHEAISEEIATGSSRRGPRRDFLTLLDEAGVLVLVNQSVSKEQLASAVREARGNLTSSDYQGQVIRLLKNAGAELAIFGHALFESRDLRPDSLSSVGAFAAILHVSGDNLSRNGIRCSGGSADRLLSAWLEDHRDKLHPALFPSLRLDIVFQFSQGS